MESAIDSSAQNGSISDQRPGGAYVNYLLLLIFLVAVMNVCDRTIIAVLAEDIARDLSLNDREMGFIMGLAFSGTYVAAGIPLARIADTRSRRVVIALSLGMWSLMTALSGAAQSFAQLTVARMGVGLGEAGGSPASQSLIADSVDPRRRARAMSLIGIGSIVGMGVGTLYGGWSSQHFGWRSTLVVVGVPGLVLALVFLATIKEPPRSSSRSRDPLSGRNLGAVLSWLLRDRRFLLLCGGAALASMYGMGRGFWEPTFLRRVYELSPAQTGLVYFALSPLPGAVGAYSISLVADRLGTRDPRWHAWIAALSTILSIPAALLFYLLPTDILVLGIPVAFCFSIGGSIIGAGWAPIVSTLVQYISPSSSRSVAAACWGLVANVGTGLGPLLVGELNTRFESAYGTQSIQYSLAALSIAPLISAVLFFRLGALLSESSAETGESEGVSPIR